MVENLLRPRRIGGSRQEGGRQAPGLEAIGHVARAVDPGVKVPPGALGQDTGRALADLGAAGADFAAAVEARRERLQGLDDANKITKVKNELVLSFTEAARDWELNDNLADPRASQRLQAELKSRAAQAIAGVDLEAMSPERRADFDAMVAGLTTAALERGILKTGPAIEADTINNLDTAGRQINAGVRAGGDPEAAFLSIGETLEPYRRHLGRQAENDWLVLRRADVIESRTRWLLDQEDFEGAGEWLAEKGGELSQDKLDTLTALVGGAEDDARLERGEKLEAEIALKVDDALTASDFDADALFAQIDAAEQHGEFEGRPKAVAQLRLLVRAEVRRREERRVLGLDPTATKAEIKVDQERHDAEFAVAVDQAEHGNIKMKDLPGLMDSDVIRTEKELIKVSNTIEETRPLAAEIKRKFGYFDFVQGLLPGVDEGTVGADELYDIRQGQIEIGAPREVVDALNLLLGLARKREEETFDALDEATYAGLADRAATLGLKPPGGDLSGLDATLAQLFDFQSDVLRTRIIGRISEDEAEMFLQKIIPAIRHKVAGETGLGTILGIGVSGSDDPYIRGIEQITNFLEDNKLEENVGLKVFLFRTLHRAVKMSGVDQMEPGNKRDLALQEIGNIIVSAYAGQIAPSLRGVPREELPNSVFAPIGALIPVGPRQKFRRGRIINLFTGRSNAPARSVGALETRALPGGVGVQVVPGTNIEVEIGRGERESLDRPIGAPLTSKGKVDKDKLVVGQAYQASDGRRFRWDGSLFQPL